MDSYYFDDFEGIEYYDEAEAYAMEALEAYYGAEVPFEKAAEQGDVSDGPADLNEVQADFYDADNVEAFDFQGFCEDLVLDMRYSFDNYAVSILEEEGDGYWTDGEEDYG